MGQTYLTLEAAEGPERGPFLCTDRDHVDGSIPSHSRARGPVDVVAALSEDPVSGRGGKLGRDFSRRLEIVLSPAGSNGRNVGVAVVVCSERREQPGENAGKPRRRTEECLGRERKGWKSQTRTQGSRLESVGKRSRIEMKPNSKLRRRLFGSRARKVRVVRILIKMGWE
ncbi:hypothetical protein VTJ49DRAFT_5005 [Mycothermus thermophilus]|uniref:Uncharacterized protein n=1 Tax=Humicola insolens TaxID=85995 RepID=A0ABR3VKW5_HUMIN